MACGCGSSAKQLVKLVNIIKHNPEVYSYDFEAIFPLDWNIGDHSKVFMTVDGQMIGKKFSYASLKEEGFLRFTTRIKENGSDYKKAFTKLKVGDLVEITTPNGNFELYREQRPILLLTNGVGMAAVRGFIKAFELDQSGIPEMIQLNVDNTGAIYESEMNAIMSKIDAFKSYYFDNRKRFYSHLDYVAQDLMSRYTLEPLIYVVGSAPFVLDLLQHLRSLGFTGDEIITDSQFAIGGAGCGCGPDNGCGCGANLEGTLVAFG